jgi:hypothetical protein
MTPQCYKERAHRQANYARGEAYYEKAEDIKHTIKPKAQQLVETAG